MSPSTLRRLVTSLALALAVAGCGARAPVPASADPDPPAAPTVAHPEPLVPTPDPESQATPAAGERELPAAPTAADLMLPAAAWADITEVVTRALAVDDGRAGGEAVPPEIAALRRVRLASSAEYRYSTGGEGAGRFKVRVDVYHDEPTAISRFRGRHLPQALAMTEPFAAGDDGFIYEDQHAGFRVGPVTVEIAVRGEGGRLREFARAYADFVASRLRGAASPPVPRGTESP